jgi:tetratricopeptide (TPR) repeat protein
MVLRNQNRFDQATEYYRVAQDKFERLGDRRLVTYPVYDMGVVQQYQGFLERSWQSFEQALGVYEEIGYQSGAAAALLNLGVLRDRRGDFESALTYFQQSRDIAEAIDEKLAIAYALFSIGAAYYKLHDYRKSLAYLKDSLKIMQSLKAKGYYGYPLSFLSSLYARTGATDRAIRMAHIHLRNVEDIGSDVENGRAYLSLAMALWHYPAHSGESDKLLRDINRIGGIEETSAEAYFHKALEVSDEAGYVNTLIPAHYHFARFARAQGRDTEFLDHLAEAYRLAKSAQWDRFVGNLGDQYPELVARFEQSADGAGDAGGAESSAAPGESRGAGAEGAAAESPGGSAPSEPA